MSGPKAPRPGLTREQVEGLVARVDELGNDRRPDPRVEPPHPPPRDAAPLSTTLESHDPEGVPAESSPRGRPEPRVHTPPSFESPAVQARAKRVIEAQGDRVEPAPVSVASSYPTATPLVVHRHRPPPWWEQGEMVLKVIGAVVAGLLALGGAGLLARGSDEPAPVKQGDIECPAFGDEKTPRGALCTRLGELEGMVGALQAEARSRKAAEEREKKMLGQEPPTLKPRNSP